MNQVALIGVFAYLVFLLFFVPFLKWLSNKTTTSKEDGLSIKVVHYFSRA